ncbi:MAG: phosphotransferase [Anaerolineae bacterium]|nr:phosphotransferase [Anaerolineae bacterium]
MFTTSPPAFIDYLTAHYPGAQRTDFKRISGGWECDIYTFRLTFADGNSRELILRVYLGNDGIQKAAHEGDGMRQLYQAGYPVPEMLLQETGTAVLGKPFLVMEKLNGQGLWAALSIAPPEQENHLLNQFGRVVAQLHQIDWRPFTPHAARYQNNPPAALDDMLNSFRRLYTEFEVSGFLKMLDWMDAQKAAFAVQPAVVHLDFHANNVFLQEDGHLSVIDWSQLTVADYRADLSWTLMIMGDNGKPGWREKILTAYTNAAGHPVEHLDYFDALSYTKLLGSTVISLRVGSEKLGMRPESIETMKQQGASTRSVYQRLQAITGIAVPEVEAVLREID